MQNLSHPRSKTTITARLSALNGKETMHSWPLDDRNGVSADAVDAGVGSALDGGSVTGSVRRPSDPCRGAIPVFQDE